MIRQVNKSRFNIPMSSHPDRHRELMWYATEDDRLIYVVTALALLSVLVFDETFAANVARDLGEEAAIMLDPWVAGIGGVFLGLLAAAFYRERRR
jgi:hypothetical protein